MAQRTGTADRSGKRGLWENVAQGTAQKREPPHHTEPCGAVQKEGNT